MSTQKPTFRVMKNGYDRFAVDDAIDQYAQQIEQLQKKLSLYQQQLVETTRTLSSLVKKLLTISLVFRLEKQMKLFLLRRKMQMKLFVKPFQLLD